MATVVSQHIIPLGRHLVFFNSFILRKTAANFTEISRKHVFAASNRNINENRVQKKKLEQIFPKIYSFLFRTLICIINYAYIISDDVIQLTLRDALIIRQQILKASFWLLESFKILWGVNLTPLDIRGLVCDIS